MRVPRPVLPTTVLLLVSAVTVVALADMARAHAALVESDPAGGETVEEALDEVTLEFSEPVSLAEVEVADPDGASVAAGAPEVDGEVVRLPLDAPEQQGEYSMAYRVVSEDEHPVEGEIAFTYEGPVTDEASSAPTETTEDDRPAGASGDGPSSAEGTEEEDPPDSADADPVAATEGEGQGGMVTLLVAGAVLAALGGAAWLALRRRGDTAA